MKKRRILLLVLACILMGAVLVLAACSDEQCTHTFSDDWSSDDTHHWHAATCEHTDERSDLAEHTWDAGEVTDAPTETEDGEKTFTCTECGKTKTESVPALGHQHDYVIVSSNNNGTHNLVCSRDSSHTASEDCTYRQNEVAPTCTTSGYTEHTCECGHSYTDNEQKANGHSFEHGWSSDDFYHWHAADCVHTDQQGDYAPHDYTIFVGTTDPSCTEDGYTIYACECGKQQKRNIVSSNGHSYGEPVEQSRTLIDDSCCKYAVTYTASCSVCGDPQQTVEYPEDHSFYYEKEKGQACTVTGEYAIKKPTCKAEGIQHKHCANPKCKYYSDYAEYIVVPADADAHVWNTGAPNQDGSMITYTCTVPHCGKTKNTAIASGDTADISGGKVDEVAIGQTTINMNQTMKDTLTQGKDTVTITAGMTENEDDKEAILKKYGFTLNDVGSNPIFSFTVSGANEEDFGKDGKATITVPYRLKDGDDRNHVIVFYLSKEGLVAIEADYWEDAGKNGFATFETTHFSDYIPASVSPEELCELFGKHSDDRYVVAPTCTAGGHTVCLRCNKIIETTDALGHKWLSTVTQGSTCTVAGTMHHVCAVCDTAYDTAIAATGHYHVLQSNTAASCKNEGSAIYACIYCNGSYTVTTPQLAHQYLTKTAAASCTERGYLQRSCTLCGDVQISYTAPLGHNFSTAWEKAEEGHFHLCLTCGARGELAAHTPGAEATEAHAQLCTACEYVLVPQLTHRHTSMTHFERNEPGCTENGNKSYYVCSCGKWFLDANGTQLITDHTSVILDATGHTHEDIPYVAPGCETPGNTAGVRCSVCQKLLRGNIEIAPTGHDYEQVITKPTCLSGGYTLFSCKCGNSYQGNETAPLGHRYTAEITLPSCTESGHTTYTCSYCTTETEGHSYVDNVLPALGHALSSALISDKDSHWHVCTRCNTVEGLEAHTKSHESATEQHGVSCTVCGYEIEPMKDHVHAAARAVEPQAASCTASGKKAHYICACGEWFADAACTMPILDRTEVIIPTTEHTLTYHEQIPATCYSKGYTAGYSCTKCSYTGGRVEIPMTDHNFNTPVLHDTEGHWHKCLTCNVTDEKLAHEYDTRVTPPTCTAPGYTDFSCACGYKYVGARTEAKGHEFGDWAANYDGTHTRVCSTDPSHREVADCTYTDEVTAPTCNQKGYTLHACECGYQYKDTYVNAKGHAFGEWTTHGNGTHTRTCANDVAHTETENCVYTPQVTPPTCTEAGYTTYTCICGHSYEADTVAPLDHAFGTWRPNGNGTHTRTCANDATHRETEDCVHTSQVTPPTCTEQGYTTYTCECGDSYKKDYTEKTEHHYINGVCRTCGATEDKDENIGDITPPANDYLQQISLNFPSIGVVVNSDPSVLVNKLCQKTVTVTFSQSGEKIVAITPDMIDYSKVDFTRVGCYEVSLYFSVNGSHGDIKIDVFVIEDKSGVEVLGVYTFTDQNNMTGLSTITLYADQSMMVDDYYITPYQTLKENVIVFSMEGGDYAMELDQKSMAVSFYQPTETLIGKYQYTMATGYSITFEVYGEYTGAGTYLAVFSLNFGNQKMTVTTRAYLDIANSRLRHAGLPCDMVFDANGTLTEDHDTQTRTEAPTCTQEGWEIVTCTKCNRTISRTQIPMLDHQYGEDGRCGTCGRSESEDKELDDLKEQLLQEMKREWESLQKKYGSLADFEERYRKYYTGLSNATSTNEINEYVSDFSSLVSAIHQKFGASGGEDNQHPMRNWLETATPYEVTQGSSLDEYVAKHILCNRVVVEMSDGSLIYTVITDAMIDLSSASFDTVGMTRIAISFPVGSFSIYQEVYIRVMPDLENVKYLDYSFTDTSGMGWSQLRVYEKDYALFNGTLFNYNVISTGVIELIQGSEFYVISLDQDAGKATFYTPTDSVIGEYTLTVRDNRWVYTVYGTYNGEGNYITVMTAILGDGNGGEKQRMTITTTVYLNKSNNTIFHVTQGDMTYDEEGNLTRKGMVEENPDSGFEQYRDQVYDEIKTAWSEFDHPDNGYELTDEQRARGSSILECIAAAQTQEELDLLREEFYQLVSEIENVVELDWISHTGIPRRVLTGTTMEEFLNMLGGATIILHYSDGSEYYIELSADMINLSNLDLTTAGSYTISWTYEADHLENALNGMTNITVINDLTADASPIGQYTFLPHEEDAYNMAEWYSIRLYDNGYAMIFDSYGVSFVEYTQSGNLITCSYYDMVLLYEIITDSEGDPIGISCYRPDAASTDYSYSEAYLSFTVEVFTQGERYFAFISLREMNDDGFEEVSEMTSEIFYNADKTKIYAMALEGCYEIGADNVLIKADCEHSYTEQGYCQYCGESRNSGSLNGSITDTLPNIGQGEDFVGSNDSTSSFG